MKVYRPFFSFLVFLFVFQLQAHNGNRYVVNKPSSKSFPLCSSGKVADLIVSDEDYIGVKKVAAHLQNDISKVTNLTPNLFYDHTNSTGPLIIIGTIGNSSLIDKLITEGKIDNKELDGKWEKFIIQQVKNPLPGIKTALVIAGSDKRGTIYGMYDLSSQIGVSPWYYWADVSIKKQNELYVIQGKHTLGEPNVKYRGIFINDEAPALRNWAKEKFGNFNHEFYEKVFELILRNKGNYLWPAMWVPSAFADDDSENTKLAHEYGIVISTSHHEPMMRAHAEWEKYGMGDWNYESNQENLKEFWKQGIERMGDYESVVTVGMRGDGDEAMSEETAVDLMKKIITAQRDIISTVTGKSPEETPQVWAIYKEVQDYYDKGMRVPEDIMILLCDDNWGNVRILPKKEDFDYEGGFGMYYHFDYVGAPVSYRWLNVTQIERVWEQMKLSYTREVRDLWLVNVGDIKPMEFPTSFFLDFAWNAESLEASDLSNYYVQWASQQFGEVKAKEIGEIMAKYTKYNARRTPEMLKPDTYSIENYREADKVLEEFKNLSRQSTTIYNELPEDKKASYFQLVQFPVQACANLMEMYIAAGKNKYYADRGFPIANFFADKVKESFLKDEKLTTEYHQLLGGKWNHMMSQTHIGYRYWNNPPLNTMPEVTYVQPQESTGLGYIVEYASTPKWDWLGNSRKWPNKNSLPLYDSINNQKYYIEILNRGREKLNYEIRSKNDWIVLSKNDGQIQYGDKVYVSIDWTKVTHDETFGEVEIKSDDSTFKVHVPIRHLKSAVGFVENNGVISINAGSYSRKYDVRENRWEVVPNLGRVDSAIIPRPFDFESKSNTHEASRVEYDFTIFQNSDLTIEAHLSPTQDYKKSGGLKFAIAIDDEEPQIININENEDKPDWQYADWWMKSVADHIKIRQSKHNDIKAGTHTLKVWAIDPGVVIQKLIIDGGGLRNSYLGPPESIIK